MSLLYPERVDYNAAMQHSLVAILLCVTNLSPICVPVCARCPQASSSQSSCGYAEAGSSAPGSTPGLQSQVASANGEGSGHYGRKELSSPSLRSDVFRQPSTSTAASQAKELLDKVVQTINPAQAAEPGHGLGDFPDIGELSFPSLRSQDMPSMTPVLAKNDVGVNLPEVPVEEESGGETHSSEGADTSLIQDDVTPVRRQVAGGLKASGSFSDALQLLLQSRPAGAPIPKVKQAFPRPRSGLMHMSAATAVAPDPSSESTGGPGEEHGDQGDSMCVDGASGSAVNISAAADAQASPPVAPLRSSSVPRDLHALPASLLASCDTSFLMQAWSH